MGLLEDIFLSIEVAKLEREFGIKIKKEDIEQAKGKLKEEAATPEDIKNYYNAYIKRYCAYTKSSLKLEQIRLEKGYVGYFDKCACEVREDFYVQDCPNGAIDLSNAESGAKDVVEFVNNLKWGYLIYRGLTVANQNALDDLVSMYRHNIDLENEKARNNGL